MRSYKEVSTYIITASISWNNTSEKTQIDFRVMRTECISHIIKEGSIKLDVHPELDFAFALLSKLHNSEPVE